MFLLAAASALAFASASQEPLPPPLIEYAPPTEATIQGSYLCVSKPVTIKIRAQKGSVEVVSYLGSAGEATAAQLAEWNRALSRFGWFTGFEFLCQDGQNELIRINGLPRDRTDKKTWQGVYWFNGRFGLLP